MVRNLASLVTTSTFCFLDFSLVLSAYFATITLAIIRQVYPTTMRKLIFLFLTVVLFSSHNMYLKFDSFFFQPNSEATIELVNGTFDKSENVIDRDRMLDASLVGNGNRLQVDTADWSEKDNSTLLNFKTGAPGTWVAGVSTRPRDFAMTAADFNDYLEHDGVLDMLQWRKDNDALELDAVERYSKHIKAIFQVGDQKTDDWRAVLGYPIEFVPLSNPYETHAGHNLKIKLLWQGEPLANQLIYANVKAKQGHGHSHDGDHEHEQAAEAGHSHEHDGEEKHEHAKSEHGHDHADNTKQEHSHDEEHAEDGHHHHSANELRTDANGVLDLALESDGIWYLRTIHLINSEEDGLTHESNWATLTFEVGGSDHSHEATAGDHGHEHEHEEEGGIPSYIFMIGSIVVLGGLFLWFNQKGNA